MGVHGKANIKNSAYIALTAIVLTGSASVEAGQKINPGDRVGIRFTCCMQNGDIAVTSEKSVAEDAKLVKSSIFVPRQADDPVEVVAGGDPEYAARNFTGFEDDVIEGIASGLTGLKRGESREIALSSSKSLNGELRLAHVRHASKEKRISTEDFKTHTGKEPKAGQTVHMEGELPGTVKEVKDGEVLITFTAAEGAVVKTPLGPVIDAAQGGLMRMGPWVGRIKYVDEKNIDLDFSRTFGGENLRCRVKAENEMPAQAADGPATAAKPAPFTAEPGKGEGPSAGELGRGVDLLEQAVSDAAKEGKTSFSMDADLLLAKAAKGDLVTVRFIARDEKGEILTLPDDMARQDTPQEVMAGNEEVFPGLGDAVVGMAPGEKKKITLPPEKAFGPKSAANKENFQLKSAIPTRVTIPAGEYVKRYGGFPIIGKELPMASYVTARVAEIGEKEVTLAVTAEDGKTVEEPFGKVTATVGKDAITIKVAPKLGAPFDTGDRKGVISAIAGDSFTVDFNHPLAGKTIVLDLEVVSLIKGEKLKTTPVSWIEEHDAGLALAKKDGKPVVLMLYADWCGFCKKLFSETMPDPRIEILKEKFVWVKVNSDKEHKYGNLYGQSGFPMIVLLNPDGTVAEKIDGFRDGAGLSKALKEFLNGKKG